MDQDLCELNEILNGQSPTSIGGIPCQPANHLYLAAKEVNSLGPEPTLSQTAMYVYVYFPQYKVQGHFSIGDSYETSQRIDEKVEMGKICLVNINILFYPSS